MAEASDAFYEIKVGPLRATLLLHGSAMDGSTQSLIRSDIEKRLASLKVVHGVDAALIDRILADKLYNQTHIVAQATLPKDGRNAWVEQIINADVEAKPRMLENGKADYKNVDNIRQVQKDQVLAIKHPPVPGTPGKDLFGNELPPAPVNDVEIKPGSNTVVSEDGTKLLAAGPGFLHTSGGVICVGQEYVVRGDVDFSTGNIRYHGTVRVKGNVTSGFSVEAEGDLIVEGAVEAAELTSRQGYVRVMQGVFGQGKGSIRAPKGDIHIAFAQDMLLECEGELTVEKGLRNCRATAGSIKADFPRCSLIGGSLKAYSEVHAYWVGAEGNRTDLLLADRQEEAARARIPEVEARKKKTESQVAEIDKRFKEIAAKATGGKLSPDLQGIMNKLLAVYGPLKKSIAPQEEERRKLVEIANDVSRRTGRILIKDRVNAGCKLNMYGLARELVGEDSKKEWRWGAEELIALTLIPDD